MSLGFKTSPTWGTARTWRTSPTFHVNPSWHTAGLSPPVVAPILVVDADVGSYVANLAWTPSNNTGAPGFGYEIYIQVDGGGYTLLDTVTDLTYDYDAGSTAGDYDFYVTPKNDAGSGPESNIGSIALPGEL